MFIYPHVDWFYFFSLCIFLIRKKNRRAFFFARNPQIVCHQSMYILYDYECIRMCVSGFKWNSHASRLDGIWKLWWFLFMSSNNSCHVFEFKTKIRIWMNISLRNILAYLISNSDNHTTKSATGIPFQRKYRRLLAPFNSHNSHTVKMYSFSFVTCSVFIVYNKHYNVVCTEASDMKGNGIEVCFIFRSKQNKTKVN